MQRLAGYRTTLVEAGIPVDEDLVYLGDTTFPAIDRVLAGFAALPDPPSAVFSSNARCSLGIYPALQRLGGEGLAMVSFGDFPMAASLQPSVTVIDQDPSAVGTFAAERLFRRITEPGKRLRRRTLLSVSLTERDSCSEPVGRGSRAAAPRPLAR